MNSSSTALPSSAVAFLLSLMTGLLFSVPLCKAQTSPAISVSTVSQAGASGAGPSFTPAFSADGQSIVFTSLANNLVTNDNDGLNLDVFVRNLTTSTTRLVSVSHTGTGGANADANFPSISSNGQFVAFASAASNLVLGDTNNAVDVFWRDITSGETRLVSKGHLVPNALGPVPSATYPLYSSYTLISADGNWVFFESSASNLVSEADTNDAPDVFAFNVGLNRTFLVSVDSTGAGTGSSPSELAGSTPDGRFVLFLSAATNLVNGTVGTNKHVYIRDMVAGTTIQASAGATNFVNQSFICGHPAMSENGGLLVYAVPRFSNDFAFSSFLLRYDMASGVTSLISSNSLISTAPAITPDGRFVAFGNGQIVLYNTQTSTSGIITRGLDNQPSGALSFAPVLSRDGRKAAFISAFISLDGGVKQGKPLTTNQASLFDIFLHDLDSQTTTMISHDTNGFGMRDIFTQSPALSPDGARIAFATAGSGLVPNDNNAASDIFLHDISADSNMLVSEAHSNNPARTSVSSSWVNPYSISSNGQVVAFSAFDGDLAGSDTNIEVDSFFRLENGSTRWLGTGIQGNPLPSLNSRAPVVSADGGIIYYVQGANNGNRNFAYSLRSFDIQNNTNRFVSSLSFSLSLGTVALQEPYPFPACSSQGRFVAYQTTGTVPPYSDGNGVYDVYVTDTWSNKVYLASHSAANAGSSDSINPIISPDDHWVLFQSHSSNLSSNFVNGTTYQLFAFLLPFEGVNPFPNQPTNLVRLLSYAASPSGPGLSDNATGAVFSADAHYVAFYTASNKVIYRHDLHSNTTNLLVCTNCLNPSLNADGQWIVYQAPRSDGITDIYLKDLQTGNVQLISKNRFGAGPANGPSSSPKVSSDGRFIVFASRASDLVESDTNKGTDVFVRDRLLGITVAVSLNQSRTATGNAPSSRPILAQDGRTIAFQSFAGDLANGDYNNKRDVYRVRLGATDSDNDGLDDEWEVAFFGNLSRNGDGDFDGDGQTDRAEFLAGTDPTNNGSVLQVLSLTSLPDGSKTLVWKSVPGKTYQVQFKDELSGDWINLYGRTTAIGATSSTADADSSREHRFYRVIANPQ